MDWPVLTRHFASKTVISPFDLDTPLGRAHYVFNATTNTSRAWPTANRAFFFPVYLPSPVLITAFAWANGATASGNVEAGIFDLQGNNLVSTGSVAQAGVSTIQAAGATDTTLQPGIYYLAFGASATTTTVLAGSSGAILLRSLGVRQSDVGSLPFSASETLADNSGLLTPMVVAAGNALAGL